MFRLPRLLSLLLALCLVAQGATAARDAGCDHAVAPVAATDAAHAHHAMPDADREVPSGGCDCGCACVDLACAHTGITFALPAELTTRVAAPASSPRFAWATAGLGQTRIGALLRPPNAA